MRRLPTWNALILAGGRSRRMGEDKAALRWQGAPLLNHMEALLREAGAARVLISGRQPDGRGVTDLYPGAGPLGGLASALPELADGWLLVLPVDLPLMRGEVLQWLLGEASGAACRLRGEALPLCLRVDAGLRAEVERLMQAEARQRSLNRLFDLLGGIERDCPAEFASTLLNCNTPEDWRAAQAAQTSAQSFSGGRSSTRPSKPK